MGVRTTYSLIRMANSRKGVDAIFNALLQNSIMTGSFLHKIFSISASVHFDPQFLQRVCQHSASAQEKCAVLSSSFAVVKIFNHLFSDISLSLEEEVILKSIIAIGQWEKFLKKGESGEVSWLLSQLLPVERFYREIGGIVGYYLYMLELLENKPEPTTPVYLKPEGKDISRESTEVAQAIYDGITALPFFAEIYPVGGAADRLSLFDAHTNEPLPAACLAFMGRPLLAGLIRDLQGKEYLHFKLFKSQCVTPIALMTSSEKNNHEHMLAICERYQWFGRPSSSFRFFSQPSVPTIDRNGNWCLEDQKRLLLKPGGHGVIWKLARDEGILKWLKEQGRTKALVRQINNPIAGLDYGLLAFTGIGWRENRLFGFASCPSLPFAQEGTNVLVEKTTTEGVSYTLTNVEYCDLKRSENFDATQFSTNTNLLFVDLKAIEEAVERLPFPGKIVNFKKTVYRSQTGEVKEEEVARLESMMQNIADVWVNDFSNPLPIGERNCLHSYITHHSRHKTISSVKKTYLEGGSFLETPEGCYRDYMLNLYELFSVYCGFEVLQEFSCVMHPALGPFFSLIGQKIQGGKIATGSDLELEIADLHVQNLEVDGAFFVEAKNVMGHSDASGIITYSQWSGKCQLKNVKVINLGIDQNAPNIFWKRALHYQERCVIHIEGYGEFFAENVTFLGNVHIFVPNGYRVTAYEEKGSIVLKEEKIETPTWEFRYKKNECDKLSHSIKIYAVTTFGL